MVKLPHLISQVILTPMAKFVAILLITGDVFVHETLTGVSICGFSTNTKNANAIWIGQQ